MDAMPDAITFADARRRLAEVAEQAEVNPILITRARGKTLVLMNADELVGLMETLRLYASPENRADLDRALAAMKRGDVAEFDPTE